MAWISWSPTWATRSKARAKPQRRFFCQLIHQNCTHWGKNLDRYWTTRSFAHRLSSVEATDHSSSSWSLERIWALSTLVWWKVEEHTGKRRRKQEKISILYRSIKTRNSLPSSSSRSFRTQSYWSFITGQCINSERFVRVHLSHRMCNQFTLHHELRFDTGRTNFEQKTDINQPVDLMNKNTKILRQSTWKHRVLHDTCRQRGRNIKTRCIGLTSDLLKKKG